MSKATALRPPKVSFIILVINITSLFSTLQRSYWRQGRKPSMQGIVSVGISVPHSFRIERDWTLAEEESIAEIEYDQLIGL